VALTVGLALNVWCLYYMWVCWCQFCAAITWCSRWLGGFCVCI